MDRKTTEIAICIGGVIVLLFLLFSNKLKGGGGRVSLEQSMSSVSQVFDEFDQNVRLLANKEINESLERLMADRIQGEWIRNPFEILVNTKIVIDKMQVDVEESEPAIPTFSISGIIHGETDDETSVIVNGELYVNGEVVDGWTVSSIEMDRVFFKKNNKEFIFNLYAIDENRGK